MSETSGRTIVGLVDAGGAGGSGLGSDWSLTFTLASWRYAGGPLEAGPLDCSWSLSESDVEDWMDRIDAFAILEIRPRGAAADGHVELEDILRTDAIDPELSGVAEALRRPILLDHPALGRLEWDRRFDQYSGRATWCGEEVDLSLSCPGPDEAGPTVAAAERLFAGQEDWRRRVEECAVERLLSLKNENWLDEEEGEPEVSREEFLGRMGLESIVVEPTGAFTFWFSDGDLFLGHMIEVSGDLRGPRDAGIAG